MTVAGNKNLKLGPKAPAHGPLPGAARSVDTKAFGRHQTSPQASERASKRSSAQA
jgi:hypothetical protein